MTTRIQEKMMMKKINNNTQCVQSNDDVEIKKREEMK